MISPSVGAISFKNPHFFPGSLIKKLNFIFESLDEKKK